MFKIPVHRAELDVEIVKFIFIQSGSCIRMKYFIAKRTFFGNVVKIVFPIGHV